MCRQNSFLFLKRWILKASYLSLFLTLTIAMSISSDCLGQEPRVRRVLYNFDGDSCMSTRAGGKGPCEVGEVDVRRLIEEVTLPGSHVDTILICINAQVMYYPTQVGTMRGALSTEKERTEWPASEKQRFENIQKMFSQGVDPYAVMIEEARRRGLETLLTFRVNDDHGNDFLKTQFRLDHPEYHLSHGALNFDHEEVRDYVYRLIEEAVLRYDCDGLELDFNRFPAFFLQSSPDERIRKMNELVERVHVLIQKESERRNRKLVLAVRVPSNFGKTPPVPASSRELGCDVAAWTENGWVDSVIVSEFLFTRYDLSIRPWKDIIKKCPVYGGIECTEGGRKEDYLTAEEYRMEAVRLRNDGADGIYLFNFFTTREYGAESWEPPFEVLRDL